MYIYIIICNKISDIATLVEMGNELKWYVDEPSVIVIQDLLTVNKSAVRWDILNSLKFNGTTLALPQRTSSFLASSERTVSVYTSLKYTSPPT